MKNAQMRGIEKVKEKQTGTIIQKKKVTALRVCPFCSAVS